MLKKKVKYLLLACSIIFCITGCGNSSISNDNITTESTTTGYSANLLLVSSEDSATAPVENIPKRYKKQVGKVNFDVEIITDGIPDTIYAGTASVQKYNQKAAYLQFFSDIEVKEHFQSEALGYDGKNELDLNYYGINGEALCLSPRMLIFRKDGLFVENIFKLDPEDNYTADQFQVNKNLSFASYGGCYSEIVNTLKKIDINIDGTYNCYALDYETIKKIENKFVNGQILESDSAKGVWENDDDSYYFAIRQTFQGLPVYYKYADIYKEAGDMNAPLQVVYSSDGIKTLIMDKIFAFKTQTDKKLSLASFDKIADTIGDKYGELLTDDVYTVKAQLHMMAQGQGNHYDMLPVWIVELTNSTNGFAKQMVVDAVTAEDIP